MVDAYNYCSYSLLSIFPFTIKLLCNSDKWSINQILFQTLEN